jgi:hypothetical protein
VFFATLGAKSAAPITGLDTTNQTLSQDTRVVEVYNNQLFVSVDSKGGKNSARSFIGTLGAQGALPTSLTNNAGSPPGGSNGPTMLPGFGNTGGTGKLTINALTTNGINAIGEMVNLSPEDYFFANATTLYVADSGNPKNDSTVSSGTSVGDGGLQKWVFNGKSWNLDYTLSSGLNLVANTAAAGTTGLFGLTGEVVGNSVELFATNATVGDTDPTFLYGLTDILSATAPAAGESFTQLAAAPTDSNFKGVAFAPTAVPEPATWAMMLMGFGGLGGLLRSARRRQAMLGG